MKRTISLLLLFLLNVSFGYGQEHFDKVNAAYEEVLYRIEAKDTLIKNRTKYYKCSEDLSGRLELYYENEQLILITHIYKQGFGNNSFLENFYLENDSLSIKTSITEEIFLNTLYKQSSQGVSSTSVEKVIEVTEQRMFFEHNSKKVCFERKYGEILSDWDNDYFNTLSFEKANCAEEIEDIQYKYRILRKAEKKLESYSNRKPTCIFHIW